MTNLKPWLIVFISILIYYLFEFHIPMGQYIIYPFKLIVTILHETGHALGALLTGGIVDSIQINPDGSGWCKTGGGMHGVVLMGGYLGSAFF
jgi:hypothetical protein